MSLGLGLALVVILLYILMLALSFFFSGSETGFISINQKKYLSDIRLKKAGTKSIEIMK